MVRPPLAVLGDDTHGEMLCFQLSVGRLDAYHGRRAKETFFTAIRLLSDGGVKTDDGGHAHDTCIIRAHTLADGPAYLVLRLFSRIIKLALA